MQNASGDEMSDEESDHKRLFSFIQSWIGTLDSIQRESKRIHL